MVPLHFQQGAAGVVVKVAGTVRANFSSPYKQSPFKTQKRLSVSFYICRLLLKQSSAYVMK